MTQKKQPNSIIIGSYVSMKKDMDYLIGSVLSEVKYGGNAFMFFSGSPQSRNRAPLEKLNINEFHRLITLNHISLDHVFIHASYLINLANTIKASTFRFACDLLKIELDRAHAIGVKTLILHPGSHVKAGIDIGLRQVAHGLDSVFQKNNKVRIALETMAGKGYEVGTNFYQLKTIISLVDKKYRHLVGVCWDLCHMHDQGYNLEIENHNQLIKQFDQIIGLDKLWVMHVNDSLNPRFSKKDRHANLGYGHIGFDNLIKLLHNPQLITVPKILETPYLNNKAPYKAEIDMIIKKEFINPFPQLLLKE